MPVMNDPNLVKILKKNFGSPNIVEGPEGLQMPESLARSIEAAMKGLPKECTYRRRAKAAAEFRLEEGERADVSFITTDTVDRDREVVIPKGINWKTYNRVVTFAHKYDQLPAGVNLWIKPQETNKGAGLIAKTQYPTKPADWGDAPWLPSAILHLMQQPTPVCTGKSIGFIPLSFREPTVKELDARPDWDDAMVIDKSIGLEYAVAPVPCNPDAEMETVSKGQLDTKTLDLVTTVMKEFGVAAPLAAPVIEEPAIAHLTGKAWSIAVRKQLAGMKPEMREMIKSAIRDEFERILGVA